MISRILKMYFVEPFIGYMFLCGGWASRTQLCPSQPQTSYHSSKQRTLEHNGHLLVGLQTYHHARLAKVAQHIVGYFNNIKHCAHVLLQAQAIRVSSVHPIPPEFHPSHEVDGQATKQATKDVQIAKTLSCMDKNAQATNKTIGRSCNNVSHCVGPKMEWPLDFNGLSFKDLKSHARNCGSLCDDLSNY